MTLLGGRAAEEVVYSGRVSTGALDDIKRATDVAYKAVAEYGLNSSIGPMSLATLSGGGLDESGGSFPWGKDQVPILIFLPDGFFCHLVPISVKHPQRKLRPWSVRIDVACCRLQRKDLINQSS